MSLRSPDKEQRAEIRKAFCELNDVGFDVEKGYSEAEKAEADLARCALLAKLPAYNVFNEVAKSKTANLSSFVTISPFYNSTEADRQLHYMRTDRMISRTSPKESDYIEATVLVLEILSKKKLLHQVATILRTPKSINEHTSEILQLGMEEGFQFQGQQSIDQLYKDFEEYTERKLGE